MRIRPIFLALCLVSSAASVRCEDVHISQRDREEIRAVIRVATSEQIFHFGCFYESQQVPGSIPVKMWRADGPAGKVKLTPIVQYERTDKVSVMTGSAGSLGGRSYTVQRIDGKWKITKKSHWMK